MALKKIPMCPYCSNEAKLVDSAIVYGRSYGMIWDCRPCDAYVGVHKNSKDHAPLGRLANKELRELKKAAHAKFDPLWKSGEMSRTEAYQYMQEVLDLDKSKAHIGRLNADECKKLIDAINNR